MTTALVVCVGNSLAADDGVGSCVHDALLTQGLPATVRLRQLGVLGIDLLELFDHDDVFVLVDAARRGDRPGTVTVHPASQLDATHSAVSAHDIGVAEAFALGQILAPSLLPRRAAVVTVEGACFDELRESLSPEVAAAIPEAIATVLGLLSQRGGET